MLLRHPGAGAVNHLKPALCRTPEYLGGYPMCANDNGGARSDLIEVVNVLNAAGTQVGNQPLVVNDMPEGMGIFSGGAGDLGLIYGLANAIADAGALRDNNVLNTSHLGIIAHPAPRADSPQEGGLRRRRGWRHSPRRARVVTLPREESPQAPQWSG